MSPHPRRTVISAFGINPKRIGGVEMFARELSRQLGEAGFQSVLAFPYPPVALVADFLRAPNVRIELMPGMFRSFSAGPAQLLRLVRRYQPSTVHLHFTGFFMTPFPLVCRLGGVSRVFFTDHGSEAEGSRPGQTGLAKRLGTKVLGGRSIALCVSDFKVRSLTATGLMPASRIHRLYDAVDADRVCRSGSAFRRRHGIAEDRLIVAQVGQVIPEKGVEDLLRAARIVAAKNPRVLFLIIGEGSGAAAYRQMARQWGLGGYVTFLGPSADPFSEGVFAAADIACTPSRWEEAFGWSIAEAMAHAKPVIGTNVGAIPELVRDGVTGYVVERGDAAALADRILLLADDAPLRMRLGRAGLTIAADRFDLRAQIAELIALYGLKAPVPAALAARAGQSAPAAARVSQTRAASARASKY